MQEPTEKPQRRVLFCYCCMLFLLLCYRFSAFWYSCCYCNYSNMHYYCNYSNTITKKHETDPGQLMTFRFSTFKCYFAMLEMLLDIKMPLKVNSIQVVSEVLRIIIMSMLSLRIESTESIARHGVCIYLHCQCHILSQLGNALYDTSTKLPATSFNMHRFSYQLSVDKQTECTEMRLLRVQGKLLKWGVLYMLFLLQ